MDLALLVARKVAPAPFGGIKASGHGRGRSKYGLDDYPEMKYFYMGGLAGEDSA